MNKGAREHRRLEARLNVFERADRVLELFGIIAVHARGVVVVVIVLERVGVVVVRIVAIVVYAARRCSGTRARAVALTDCVAVVFVTTHFV